MLNLKKLSEYYQLQKLIDETFVGFPPSFTELPPFGSCECDACNRAWFDYRMCHDSDCAVHNMPMKKNGSCNCKIRNKQIPLVIFISLLAISIFTTLIYVIISF